MGLLDEIIDGSTDDAVSTSNLLRKVQIVSHRLAATDIHSWASRELRGFDDADNLPDYRSGLWTSVVGQWMTPGWQVKERLSTGELPDDFVNVGFKVDLTQSLAELEQLSAGESDAMIAWPGHLVVAYAQAARQGLVPMYQDGSLINAHKTITRGSLLGVIDTVRNTALDLALQLQSADPNAGAVDGPTVAEAPLAKAVWNVTTNIYGDGAQVAQGENIHQRTRVAKGDLSALLAAVKSVGLSDDGQTELARAVLADERTRPRKIESFLGKVREGAFIVGTGVTTDVLATQLETLITTFVG